MPKHWKKSRSHWVPAPYMQTPPIFTGMPPIHPLYSMPPPPPLFPPPVQMYMSSTNFTSNKPSVTPQFRKPISEKPAADVQYYDPPSEAEKACLHFFESELVETSDKIPTDIVIIDFDRTLLATPQMSLTLFNRESRDVMEYKLGLGKVWFQNKKVLDKAIEAGRWDPNLLEIARDASKMPNVLLVITTSRTTSQIYSIDAALKAQGIERVDHYACSSSDPVNGPTDDHVSDGHVPDGHVSDEHVSDEHVSDDHVSDDHVSDDHTTDDHADEHVTDEGCVEQGETEQDSQSDRERVREHYSEGRLNEYDVRENGEKHKENNHHEGHNEDHHGDHVSQSEVKRSRRFTMGSKAKYRMLELLMDTYDSVDRVYIYDGIGIDRKMYDYAVHDFVRDGWLTGENFFISPVTLKQFHLPPLQERQLVTQLVEDVDTVETSVVSLQWVWKLTADSRLNLVKYASSSILHENNEKRDIENENKYTCTEVPITMGDLTLEMRGLAAVKGQRKQWKVRSYEIDLQKRLLFHLVPLYDANSSTVVLEVAKLGRDALPRDVTELENGPVFEMYVYETRELRVQLKRSS